MRSCGRLAVTDLPYPNEPERTHWIGCWRTPKHHDCCVARVDQLTAFVREIDCMCDPDAGFVCARCMTLRGVSDGT